MEKNFMEMSANDFLKLPERKWNETKKYHSILIIPTKNLHDSGYNLFAIVGTDKRFNPIEIAAYCDDMPLSWFNESNEYGRVRIDVTPKGFVHFHSYHFDFEIGHCLSTTDCNLIRNDFRL